MTSSGQTSVFLDAFKGHQQRVPIWIMRQAGRYLPQYRELKAKRTLNDMFRDPDTAAEITLMPVDILKVDAAILFADILTLPSGLGFKIDFIDGKGPVVENPILGLSDLKRLSQWSELEYIQKIIKQVNKRLDSQVPLIGFAGSPYTVLSYLCPKHARLMQENPRLFLDFMQGLTQATIDYLKYQQQAGIKAYQLFDTWAGQLRQKDYDVFVLPFVNQIFEAVGIPSIYYLKNCSHLVTSMMKVKANALSVCETVTIGENTQLNQTHHVIQGNLLNTLLYAEDAVLINETHLLLQAAKKHHRKYIFNLSHGVFPDISVEKVKLLVQTVQQFRWQ